MSEGTRRGARCAVASVVLVSALLTGCGDRGDDRGDDRGGDGASSPGKSDTDDPTSTAASPTSPGPGDSADGTCGAGEVGTKVVRAAQGVELTVPQDWEAPSTPARDQIALLPPDRDRGDGYIVVEDVDQTLAEAVEEALRPTLDSATRTSTRPLDLEGLAAAQMDTFRYDDQDRTYAVSVVAVDDDGLRVVADMTREGSPEQSPEQALAESCLSSIRRTP